jgi:predicted GNAT family N-acyltransferase
MDDVEVRRLDEGASLGDAFDVRIDVFVEGQDVAEDLEMDGEDEDARHVVAYDGDDPVGTARLRSLEPGLAKIERVAVRDAYRDRGVGRVLMAAIEDVAREEGHDAAVLHAQTRVEEFYRKLGYATVSDVFEEAGIPHVEMEKPIGRDSWTC